MHNISKKPRKRIEGDSRERIIISAVELARTAGLEGLSFADLAKKVGMSKAGLFAHFKTKEELQLAAVDAARKRFLLEVIGPAQSESLGLARLYRTLLNWLAMLEKSCHQGGCFFYAASAEFDGRKGPVRQALVEAGGLWLEWIARQAEQAISREQLRTETNSEQLAYELHAFGQQANWVSQMLRDPRAYDRSRSAMRNLLLSHCTDTGRAVLDQMQATNEGHEP
jgi:AcrR family transcriptional regulator